MAIYQRESFLNRLAERMGRERRTEGVERPKWNHQPQHRVLSGLSQDDLVEVLEKQCAVIHTVFRQTSSSSLADVLKEVIASYGGKQLITAKDARNETFGLDQLYHQLRADGVETHVWEAEKGKENQVIAERADIGITFSDMTLAESGTVVLFHDKNHGRSISLLPQNYIAIIPKSTLVPRYTQMAERVHRQIESGQAVGSYVSLITGPSNSADIEMKLIVGVHGPVHATYIVVEDR